MLNSAPMEGSEIAPDQWMWGSILTRVTLHHRGMEIIWHTVTETLDISVNKANLAHSRMCAGLNPKEQDTDLLNKIIYMNYNTVLQAMHSKIGSDC